ncbi:MAG: hypothetical protein EB023_13185 [Flavobacteriia bacterium]|nr:hypothetical protein [Flavobacteriia bacterium]
MLFRYLVLSGLIFKIFVTLGQGSKQETSLNSLMDAWHKNATLAQFEPYFSATADDFIFLGTAPGEMWDKTAFMAYSKPYFDSGKAWRFTPKNRVWNFSENGKTAWFVEDLETWMLGCRGSGVCTKTNKGWKIRFYNLGVLIENEKIKEFIELRKF